MLCSFLLYNKVIQFYIHIHSFTFFPLMVYPRIFNIVPCALQQDLVVYPSYIKKLTSTNPSLQLHPSTNALPLGNHQSVLYVHDSVSVS